MIHLVASGPSVLTTWKNTIPKRGDVVCAVSGAARYVDDAVLDWHVVADRNAGYDPLLDPPVPPKPKRGFLTDDKSADCFKGSAHRIEVHIGCWPLPHTARKFSAPCAAIWLLEHYPGMMQLYGVDLIGRFYAWNVGPQVDIPADLLERWDIERQAWAAIITRYPKRVRGLPKEVMR